MELRRGVSLTMLCSYRLEMGLYLAWRHCPQEVASSLPAIRKERAPCPYELGQRVSQELREFGVNTDHA